VLTSPAKVSSLRHQVIYMDTMVIVMIMTADLGDSAECEGDGLGEVGVREQVGIRPQRDGRHDDDDDDDDDDDGRPW
jgi:hypothetical protein